MIVTDEMRLASQTEAIEPGDQTVITRQTASLAYS